MLDEELIAKKMGAEFLKNSLHFYFFGVAFNLDKALDLIGRRFTWLNGQIVSFFAYCNNIDKRVGH